MRVICKASHGLYGGGGILCRLLLGLGTRDFEGLSSFRFDYSQTETFMCVSVNIYIHTYILYMFVCACRYVYTSREKHTYMFVVMRIKENIGLQGFGLGILRSQGAYIYRSRHLIITITSRVALLERGAPEELGGRCWDGGLGRSFWGRRVWKARGCLGRRGR